MDTPTSSPTPSFSRSPTPSFIGDGPPCIFDLADIKDQLLNDDEEIRYRCLANFRLGKSPELYRCKKSSNGFRTARPILFNKANKFLLGEDPVSPMDYSSSVIRLLFCDTHSKATAFKQYFEFIHPHWKGNGSVEEKELLEAIRQAHGLPDPTNPAPAVDVSRVSPPPISITPGIPSRVNDSGSLGQPIISCTPPPAGTASSGRHTQSLPRLDSLHGSSRELRTHRHPTSSTLSRQTCSRSNPPQMDDDSRHPQETDNQLSYESGQNLILQNSTYNFRHLMSQTATSGPSSNTAVSTTESSAELPHRGFLSPSTPSRHMRHQSSPSPLSKSSSHSKEADAQPGPKTAPGNTTRDYCNSPSKSPFDFSKLLDARDNYNSPPNSSFDFSFSTPRSQVADSPPRTSDPEGLEFFPTISGLTTPVIHRPGLHEQPKAATEPLVTTSSAFTNADTLPVPFGPVYDASRQAGPTVARSLQPERSNLSSSYSPTDWVDISNRNEWSSSLNSGGNRLGPNKTPQRQTSKDDTFLEQTARFISAAAPPLFDARTEQTVDPKAIAKRAQDPLCPTSVDRLIRKVIMKDVNKEGHVYILKAPKYFKLNFPSDPPLLKIGMTVDVSTRMNSLIHDCKMTDLAIVAEHQIRASKFYWRIEELVHCELQNFRRVFKCKKCTSASGNKTEHKEWFAVSEEVAVQTVERWREFIEKDPYDENGILKDYWSKKIQLGHMVHPNKYEKWDDSHTRDKRWTEWLTRE